MSNCPCHSSAWGSKQNSVKRNALNPIFLSNHVSKPKKICQQY